MKITKSQLKQIIAEEFKEARLPAWERPGYDPEAANEYEVLVPGYGKLRIDQIRNKLITMIQEAAEDVQKEPPRFTHFKNGVMIAFYETLKEHGAI